MMDIRPLSSDFAVLNRPLHPEDVADIAAGGYLRIINNRPDAEVPAADRGDAIAAACRAAGIDYVAVPFSHAQLTPQVIADFAAAMGAPGPVLAYCRSGARSTTLWALAQARAGLISVDQILSAARAAGYDLDQHRPLLESLAGQG